MIKSIIKKLTFAGICLTDGLVDFYLKALKENKFGRIKHRFGYVGKDSKILFPWYNLSGLNRVIIGNKFLAREGLYLATYEYFGDYEYSPTITIGNNVGIGRCCQITAVNRIEIGDGVLIGSNVLITDHSHGNTDEESIRIPPLSRKLETKGPVVIGNNVWIGSGVAILPNVQIGDNSIVGANSVVTKSFSNNSVIGGNPAILIKII